MLPFDVLTLALPFWSVKCAVMLSAAVGCLDGIAVGVQGCWSLAVGRRIVKNNGLTGSRQKNGKFVATNFPVFCYPSKTVGLDSRVKDC